MILFEQADAPTHHKRLKEIEGWSWFTWSKDFLKDLPLIKKQTRNCEVELIYLKNLKEYNYTYSLNTSCLNKDFLNYFKNYAYDLFHFTPGENVVLFTGLIDNRVTANLLHFLFALFRKSLATLNGREMAALYTPLSKDNQNEFPLHCDLYIPKILWNVFEKVADDGSGYSTFLRLDTLFSKVLPQASSIDTQTTNKLKRLVFDKSPKDNYQQFFDTLYEQCAWSNEVQKLQREYKLRIRFQKGEGYMLHDRIWMHGREKTTPVIGAKRLHRLVFDNFHEYNPK